MAESKLDQIVKGAPPTGTKPLGVTHNPPQLPADPLSILPSSPPQIYNNLLILEASLRAQYLTLRARRRQHTFFLSLLAIWIAYFAWLLFFRLREDGRIGGSVYWVIELCEKLALMGGAVTAILVWGTGQWERGVRWPRRWVGIANRGLRGVNSKLVIIKGPWWMELLSTISVLFPYSSFFPSQGSSYHYVAHLEDVPPAKQAGGNGRRDSSIRRHSGLNWESLEEDLAPGGDYVKLLLLPKPFSPGFRENWETFRSEYWETENERRAKLRHKLKQRERKLAKQEGGWLWWTGWRGWRRSKASGAHESSHPHAHHHTHRHQDSKSRLREPHRSGSQSRNSSRSTTPTFELDDHPVSERTRRGSSNSTISDRERKKKSKSGATGSSRVPRMTPATSKSSPTNDRHVVRRENSAQSLSSGNESERSITPTSGEPPTSRRVSGNAR